MKYQTRRRELIDEISQLIVWKVNKTMAVAPTYPYQAVFSIHQYQEQLLLRVIKELYSYYRITKDEKPNPLKMLRFCLEEETEIDFLVQQSAVQILEDDTGWMEDVQLAIARQG